LKDTQGLNTGGSENRGIRAEQIQRSWEEHRFRGDRGSTGFRGDGGA